jgi:hypothetical protein
MAPAEVQLAQVGEGVEVAEEGFRDGREVRARAHVVEVGHELAADAVDSGVAGGEETVRLEKLQMPGEFFTIEIREGLAFVWIHPASAAEEQL